MIEGQSQQSTVITADKGRKLVFDNFDFKRQAHSMTEQHQNIDVHWVTHMSVENRVSGNHLSSAKPAVDAVMQMENGVCLQTRHEHHLREQFWKYPVWHWFLKPVVCKHIPHQYSKEMAEKSEMVKMTYRPTGNKEINSGPSKAKVTEQSEKVEMGKINFLVLKSCFFHVPVTVKVRVWNFVLVRYN